MSRTLKVLATDLDGTLIPLAGNEQNQRDLRLLEHELQVAGIGLAFATGRHLASVRQAIDEFQLPRPDWIICDVGTSLYHLRSHGDYEASAAFADHLSERIQHCSVKQLAKILSSIPSLQCQEAEKQTRFKLSYYTTEQELASSTAAIQTLLVKQRLPYSIIASIDPFEHVGLIDLLPRDCSKAYALQWWSRAENLTQHEIVYAGDSGNDAAALGAGYRAIVVGNAAPAVLAAAQEAHADAGLQGHLYAAHEPATSGVLAGVRHFLRPNPIMP